MSTNVSSSADFQLANMADDLLALTLDLCGRKAENGWISEKQRDRWSKLTVNVKWKIVAWMKSDTKKR